MGSQQLSANNWELRGLNRLGARLRRTKAYQESETSQSRNCFWSFFYINCTTVVRCSCCQCRVCHASTQGSHAFLNMSGRERDCQKRQSATAPSKISWKERRSANSTGLGLSNPRMDVPDLVPAHQHQQQFFKRIFVPFCC